MIELIIYFSSLLLFFYISFKVLRAINIESVFKKGKTWEIRTFYLLVPLIMAHVLSSIILKFYEWAFLIIQA